MTERRRAEWLRFSERLEPYTAVGTVLHMDSVQVVAREDVSGEIDRMVRSHARLL
jgi:hypothetical protein